MKPARCILQVLILLVFLVSVPVGTVAEPVLKAYVIPVSGTVEPGLAAYVKRSLQGIKNDSDAVFVFKLDTFGGRVDSAFDIVDAVSEIPREKSIAFVEKRAISAGALIALSAGRLVMKKNTIIGDCAPMIQTQEGQEMAGEKVQTVLRAKFRALARKNGYPVVLSESMVTMDMEVYEVEMGGEKHFMDQIAYNDLTETEKKSVTAKKTVVAKGELLTMDDMEALELGFSRASTESLEEALALLGYAQAQVVTIQESWSESLVRFLQPLLPVLMLIGLGAVYMEIKAPGFGLPGVLGIVCLGLVFFNQYLVGLADYTELMLLLIGALLLGIEVFVFPGFGVAGFSGLLVLAVGLVLSFQGFVIPDATFPWQARLLMTNLARVLGSLILAFVLSLVMVRFVLPRISRNSRGPYLETTLAEAHVDVTSALMLAPGDTGTAHTFLRPSGKIVIGDRKIDAVTQGEFIEQGEPVVVLVVDKTRVIVKTAAKQNKGLE